MAASEWQLGEETSFLACYRATVPDVYRYAAALCGRDRSAAEDLVQETYLALLRRARDERLRSVSLPYLLTMVRHRFLDELKRRSREERRLALVATATDDEPASSRLEELGDLPERERAAMVLRFVDDLTVAGVAQAMSISTRAAESLLARASRRLRGGERRHG